VTDIIFWLECFNENRLDASLGNHFNWKTIEGKTQRLFLDHSPRLLIIHIVRAGRDRREIQGLPANHFLRDAQRSGVQKRNQNGENKKYQTKKTKNDRVA
jgi:hypothetical protein